MSVTRSFHVSGVPGLVQSVFHGSTPSGASAKAFNAACKKKKSCKEVLTVMDIKSGKKHIYKCERKFEPKTVSIGGKDVTFNYSTKIHAVDSKKAASLRKTISKNKKKNVCVKKCSA